MSPFNPENPFNIRGVLISPESAPGVYVYNTCFYLILMDIKQGNPLPEIFLTNPLESGATLTYTAEGNLDIPAEGDSVSTINLPLYTNQNIVKPNADQNNLLVTIQINGVPYSGNPNSRRPPIFDVINNENPYQMVIGKSVTDASFSLLAFLTNSGPISVNNLATANLILSIVQMLYQTNPPTAPQSFVIAAVRGSSDQINRLRVQDIGSNQQWSYPIPPNSGQIVDI